MVFAARRLAGHQPAEDGADSLRCEQRCIELVGDDLVELVHRDGPARTGRLALLGAGSTGVVAVTAGLARAERHPAAAASASGKAGQEDGTGDNARRRLLRVAGFQAGLHGIKKGRVDDGINRHHNLVGGGLVFLCLPDLAVKAVLTLVGRAGQEGVQRADTPPRAAPGSVAPFVQVAGKGFDAERTARAVAFVDKAEHEPHHLCLHGIDGEAFLGFCSPLLRSHYGVSIRRGSAIPETLPGVLLHGAENVLCVLLGLVFVEQCKDLADHDAHRVIAKVLRDANEPYAVLAKAANMIFEREVVAGEAAERMDDDDIEGRVAPYCEVEQALQLGTAVVGPTEARIDELDDNLPAARLAEFLRLSPLVGNGKVVFGLASGRDA